MRRFAGFGRQYTGLLEKQVATDSSSLMTELVSEWIYAHGSSVVRILQVLRATDANYRGKVRVRFAAVRTDQPGSWTDSAAEDG